MLCDAVERWPNPTVFLEHKLLYGEMQDPAGYEIASPDAGDHAAVLFPTLRRGTTEPDVTLVAFGGMLPAAERAAKALEAEEELGVEIVVPSLLAPLPAGTLLACLIDRPRIVVVEESHPTFGVSAEIVALLAEAGYAGRVTRLGTAPVPIASARSLERDQIPDEDAIARAVLDII
jgi:2-oxoisovalerate dehydrogenase E1 component